MENADNPLMPLLPLLGIASQLVLAVYLFNLSPIAWYVTLIWIGAGTLFYAVFASRAEAMPEPVRAIHEEIIAVTEYSVLIPVANESQARLLGILGSSVARDCGGEVFALRVVRVSRQLSITERRFFLKQTKPVLETVIEEVRQFEAESEKDVTITLLHVLPEEADEIAMAWAKRLLADVASHYDYPLAQKVTRAPDVMAGILQEAETCNLLMIGATAERPFEQRLFGSIPERVARETTETVIMTKRYWRFKSLLRRIVGQR